MIITRIDIEEEANYTLKRSRVRRPNGKGLGGSCATSRAISQSSEPRPPQEVVRRKHQRIYSPKRRRGPSPETPREGREGDRRVGVCGAPTVLGTRRSKDKRSVAPLRTEEAEGVSYQLYPHAHHRRKRHETTTEEGTRRVRRPHGKGEGDRTQPGAVREGASDSTHCACLDDPV